jgi:glycosyltransferase involved in cell wall biosynthesis
MLFFSIIIPTFNSGKTLSASLRSILSQTFTDYEILLVDGASTDDTLDLAKSFNDKRIKIYSKPDEGAYDAMNKGVKAAQGEWLYFLGSDDKMFNTSVLERVYTIINTGNEKVVYGNALINGDTGWAKHGDLYDGKFTIEKLLKKYMPPGNFLS